MTRIRNFLSLTSLCLLVLGTPLCAQGVVTKTVDLSQELMFSKITGADQVQYDLVEIEDSFYPIDPGSPMVPGQHLRLAIPKGFDAVGADAHIKRTTKLGAFNFFPSQQALPLSQSRNRVFNPPNKNIYTKNAPFPNGLCRFIDQGSLSGYKIADLAVHPLQWNPVTKELLLHEIEVSLILKPATSAPPVKVRSPGAEKIFNTAVRNLVANPEQVPLNGCSGFAATGDLVEYLIITHPSYTSIFQPLADWKKVKGFPSEVKTTSWVYANYGSPGDDNQTRIRECIKDYWQNKGLVFVLLAGDTGSTPVIPDRRAFCINKDKGDKIPCDLYYADLDGDWDGDGDGIYGEHPADNIDMYADIYLGRASVDNTNQATRFVDRCLQYEGHSSMPPLNTTYLTKMLFLAAVLDSTSDGKDLKNNIDNNVIPSQFDPIKKCYQSNGTLSPSIAISEINSGYNFINHSGHGFNDSLQMGNNQYVTNPTMASIANGPCYSIFYSHSCLSLNFAWASGDCIGEKFANAANGGGFYIGNSRNGWGAIPIYGSLSGRYDKEFFKSIFDTGEYYFHLGQVHTEAKNKRVGISKTADYERYCLYELNLIGDPEMCVWKNTPKNLTVVHPSSVPVGKKHLKVHVNSGGTWAKDARVCLRQGGEIVEVLLTDVFGNAWFDLNTCAPDDINVTVVKGDHYAYEGVMTVEGELFSDINEISETTGGVVNLSLFAGAVNSGRPYIIFGSITGTSPGTPFPGGHITLPLNWDLFTNIALSLANTPIFINFMGYLDGSGQSTAKFDTFGPLPSGFAGTFLYYAFALDMPWDFASNPLAIEITP